ncbi:MAG: DUF433 domain-containing protein [Leptolyngbyaceae cyanobacterium bins.349]|nr:DUF433 domain-containing protein [Leptolyngbyaceae cyanobacterium bins.349]
MSATKTDYKYVLLDEGNHPVISGTSIKVVELITSMRSYGWSPEELKENFPHLSLSQIYSALAYYWDHQEQIDADMERRYAYVTQLRQESEPSPVVKKLRDHGLIA